jgi:HK97 family phage prohead protease
MNKHIRGTLAVLVSAPDLAVHPLTTFAAAGDGGTPGVHPSSGAAEPDHHRGSPSPHAPHPLTAFAAAGDGGTPTEPPILDFVVSDETLDRYGEVIVADGWDLRHYRANPVFQNAHNYGSVLDTIGRAVITEVRNGKLWQRIEFAIEANPLARVAYGLYKGGFLKAVSVGFLPLEWEEGTAKTPWRRRYLRQELLEVSAVGIPANPNALLMGVRSGAVRKEDIAQLAELLGRRSKTNLPDPWLSIMRTLRDLTNRKQNT